ncbi:MAG: lipid-A-disaccharide synthase [Flavobacteriales bacterium]|nr:MAG: lipid-A-disaccharide synthase [Flavobacteriales bacterium]
MKYYIIVGEASGDLHGSNLIKEIKKLDESAEFRCWGGDLMREQGAAIVKHIDELAFMGFAEVVVNLRTIFKNISFCKNDIEKYRPDVVILIDYPGFNLRIAEFVKEKGMRVFYYISPQVWAWKQSRVKKIKKSVDKLFVILPFEKEFYQRFDYDVEFVGHPLLDAIVSYEREKKSFEEFIGDNQLEQKPIVAVLPGSRKQEISKMLPVMLKMGKEFPDYQFVIGAAPSITDEFYRQFVQNSSTKILKGKTYELLQHATAGVVTSGTATLETALFSVPEVVCYKGGKISYQIAKRLVKVDYISLVNLIMGKETVKELIQSEFNEKNLKAELYKLLNNADYRGQMLADYKLLKEKLGGKGASEKTARLMLKTLSEG